MNLALALLVLWAGPPQKMVYGAGYIPNVQFAPFYVAIQRGYYKQEGIELVMDYTMGPDVLKLVALGKMEIGSADPDAFLHAAEQGLPLIHVATLYQSYPIALIARENILSAEGLKGKRIGISGTYGSSYLGLKAILEHMGLELKDIKLASIGYTQTATLAQGRADAVVGYINNEPLRLQQQGVPTHTYMLPSHQAMPGVGLMTSRTFLDKNRALVQGFLRATFRGMDDVIKDPAGCYALVVANFLPELKGADANASEYQVLLATLPFWKVETGYGQASQNAWKNLVAMVARDKDGRTYSQWEKQVDRSFVWRPK